LQGGISVGRSNIKTVAERRLPEVKKFVFSLLHSSKEIINSDLVVTFFHPLLRDQQEANINATKMKEDKRKSNEANICGEIKFSMHYHRDTFIVMVSFKNIYYKFFVYFNFLDSSRAIIAFNSHRTRAKHIR
jgi:phosphatidylinositol-4-phosphate 3-kinase